MSNYESKLVDSSRALTEMLSSEVGCDTKKFDEMFRIALYDKYPASMRAARVLQFCTEKYPYLVLPYLNKIVGLLEKIKVDGVNRSFLKMLAVSPTLPAENSLGPLIDFCFNALQNQHNAVAIKSYSIDILLIIIEKYPELAYELYSIIESVETESSPGMKVKYRNTMKILAALIEAK